TLLRRGHDRRHILPPRRPIGAPGAPAGQAVSRESPISAAPADRRSHGQTEEKDMLDKPHDPEGSPTPDYAPDRWSGISRSYRPADVRRLSGSLPIRHSLAENGARKLWQ